MPSPLRLPPADPHLSGHTGWTRAHWESVADHLLESVVPYASDGFAQFRLPGAPSRQGVVSDGLEGFARTFLLAAFRIAGAGGDVPAALLERYAAGLVAGTDPGHPYAWPPLRDMAQPLVEAASVALALHETRPWLYDRLSPAQQERVVAWLAGFVGRRTPANNWVLFQVVVEQFLAEVGGPHDPAEIAGGLERAEEWYAGDGWYSDGTGKNFDYYCGWAMHQYTALWARMAGDTGRRQLYAGRLRRFLEQYQHMFAADGGPVHQGRSLIYRFATVAPLWLGALTGASPLPPGRTRRIASGVLRHFVERGVPDGRGLLTCGWYDAFPPGTQGYSGPGSPYWASKAFLGLLLPPGHPVWTDPEEAAPIDLGDQVVAMRPPGWVLHATRADGVVRLVNHGSDRDRVQDPAGPPDPHYLRFGYTSHTGPDIGPGALDNQLAVLTPQGAASQRRRIEPLGVGERFAASAYRDGPVRVVTASVIDGAAEIRVHRVTAPAGHRVRDGGHALAAQEPPAAESAGVRARARRADGLVSEVRGLHGYTGAGVAAARGVNAFGSHSATPYVICDAHPGGTAVYVSRVLLTAAGPEPPAPRVEVRGEEVTLTPADGEPIRVRFGGEPECAVLVPGGGHAGPAGSFTCRPAS
ncbi:hypothetical protein HNP84_004260 [Thermocatellispora tengchongensis]|uniref:DUF2264 domain-containing protein n=1 Tax=Thermocatellispora tengchongensis TaxID=1073253 RepID=A0A840P4C8_9ACTN|nr:DUF2264 domain-containing protein [Thermocatellispora tengchongensis]MBB5134528.1 hypothetical protein [Thermocatellispora tengchongensis]